MMVFVDRKEFKVGDGGVYEIYCSATGKSYIGSTRCFDSRYNVHKTSLKHRKHYNSELQKDYNVEGAETFSFCVLCTLIDTSRDNLDMFEAIEINERLPGTLYNKCSVSMSKLSLKIKSIEEIKRSIFED